MQSSYNNFFLSTSRVWSSYHSSSSNISAVSLLFSSSVLSALISLSNIIVYIFLSWSLQTQHRHLSFHTSHLSSPSSLTLSLAWSQPSTMSSYNVAHQSSADFTFLPVIPSSSFVNFSTHYLSSIRGKSTAFAQLIHLSPNTFDHLLTTSSSPHIPSGFVVLLLPDLSAPPSGPPIRISSLSETLASFFGPSSHTWYRFDHVSPIPRKSPWREIDSPLLDLLLLFCSSLGRHPHQLHHGQIVARSLPQETRSLASGPLTLFSPLRCGISSNLSCGHFSLL